MTSDFEIFVEGVLLWTSITLEYNSKIFKIVTYFWLEKSEDFKYVNILMPSLKIFLKKFHKLLRRRFDLRIFWTEKNYRCQKLRYAYLVLYINSFLQISFK